MSDQQDTLIVILDDDLDKVSNLADDLRERYAVQSLEPWHLDEDTLRHGTVFLVDLFLRDWPGRERLDPSAQIYDGIALAALIRARARHEKRHIPIIALNTGHAEDFSGLPSEIREHAIARAHNLEWVFLKNDTRSRVATYERVGELVEAQRRLPREWRAETGEQELLKVLDAHEDELSDVLDGWPPIREVSADSSGIALLRWLLHRILPYPCFLLESRYVAARLGITCGSLEEIVGAEQDELGQRLGRCRYTGILGGFDGPRWWRSRLEGMLWGLSGAEGLPATTSTLQAHTSVELKRAAISNGVVVLRADYTTEEESVDVAEAVRIRLDDWPPYAEEPWAAIKDVLEDQGLRERVLPLDRPRLERRQS